MATMKKFLLLALIAVAAASASGTAMAQDEPSGSLPGKSIPQAASSDPFGWNHLTASAQPACFWWWLGSSVNEAEIERQLKVLKDAGFGGVMVCPLYPYKHPSIASIPFLSDRWVEVFRFTLAKGKELGMIVDVTTGGGWPIGGPWISKEHSERDWRLDVLSLDVTPEYPFVLRDEPGKDPIKMVTLLDAAADADPGEAWNNLKPAKVIEAHGNDGPSAWHIPPVGKCSVLVARMGYTGLDVYVGGEGAKGPVFDWYSPAAFDNLVAPLNKMLGQLGELRPRAVYCDSYEGRAGTTPGFFAAFEKVNKYDVRPYMHQFLKETGTPENIRLWHDYRQTMAQLHVEFVQRWTQWANKNGIATRYQYDGDPANPIDTCAEADIPEDGAPFSTSPAHFLGKKLVSEEAFTWGAGHNFKDNLDFYRQRGDQSLLQGVNHKIYHGVPFTPLSEPWPGPMYYAGGNFSETQPFFKHIRCMNDYFARLQLLLQESVPDTDVLLLWSIHDFWNMPNLGGFKFGQPFVWRNTNSAFERRDVKRELGAELTGRGLQTDFCSDAVVTERTRVENGLIRAGQLTCRALVVPETEMIGTKTLDKLEQLARDGGTIIFMKHIPLAAPQGLPLVQDMSKSAVSLYAMAETNTSNKGGVHIAAGLDDLFRLLRPCGLVEEGIRGRLTTYRVNQNGKMTCLVKNNNAEARLDDWVPFSHFGATCAQVLVGNPRTAGLALAEHRVNPEGGQLVHLVLEPSEVLVVAEMGANEFLEGIQPVDYREPARVRTIGTAWVLSWSDYQGRRHQLESDTLKSWTELPELALYSGVVSYETSFTLEAQEVPDNNNASKAANHWLLDAGKVHDSAEVFVNGNRVGCVWTTPFQLDISRHLRKGANTLRLDVVNKAQNRIIDMHRRGVDWQKCNLEVNDETGSGRLKIDTLSPLVSGLLGPVSLRCSE
jgi:hypothetical protein